jgi:hypothetical protein
MNANRVEKLLLKNLGEFFCTIYFIHEDDGLIK